MTTWASRAFIRIITLTLTRARSHHPTQAADVGYVSLYDDDVDLGEPGARLGEQYGAAAGE